MYTKPTQYPEMRGLGSLEQKHLLKAALNSHGKTIKIRFYIVLATVLFCGGAMGVLGGIINFSQKLSFFIPIILGIIFYIYLLWEINGAFYVAVQSIVKQNLEKGISADHPDGN